MEKVAIRFYKGHEVRAIWERTEEDGEDRRRLERTERTEEDGRGLKGRRG